MAFTYDPANLDGDLVSRVRLLIGDTVQSRGPRPDGKNFEDEEILFFLGETDNNPALAAAYAAETLASEWASAANIAVGPRREELGEIAKQWERRAKRLRAMKSGAPVAHVGRLRNALSDTGEGEYA